MDSELLTRGVAKVIPQTLAEQKLKSGKPMRVYWGIDPTGTRIHLGHSVPLRKMKHFADAGHHVIMVIGSFTAMIGDPTGQDTQRAQLTREQVQENFRTYKEQAAKILDFSKIEVRYNHEWLEKLTFADILFLARQFTLNQMASRAMFQERLSKDKPVSLHEFLYPLMVGYDSVTLDVDCELGGTDQEFNMLCGRHLQEVFKKRDKFILTTRLIEGTDGRKMSKSYENCVYLDDEPNDMYGKLLSIRDDLITTYMECCTDIPMAEIRDAGKAMKKGSNPKDFKMRLAKEIVRMYHGEKAAEHAETEFQHVFKDKGVPEDVQEVKVKKGSLLVDVLVQATLASSKTEAKRLIEQGGVKIDDKVVSSIEAKVSDGLTPEALAKGVIVKVGKRKFAKIVVT